MSRWVQRLSLMSAAALVLVGMATTSAAASTSVSASGALAASETSDLSMEDTVAVTVWEGSAGPARPPCAPGFGCPDPSPPTPLPSFQCPSSHPWLVNEEFSWKVPRGVQIENDFLDIRIGGVPTYDPVFGHVTGWGDGDNVAINQTPFVLVDTILIAQCTNDSTAGYPAQPTTSPSITSNEYMYFPEQSTQFTVTATGFPAPSLKIIQGALFEGQTFTDNGDGTATIKGRGWTTSTFTSILVEAKSAYGSVLQRINLYR